ncbi:protein lin-28 homolog isoform X2 [Bemisia tabaci]|uniref:protein lin-28 homolog isoform X2 n=1 Tax=Bemisia tabaci TaxID=7038 RepID=UPI001946DFC9
MIDSPGSGNGSGTGSSRGEEAEGGERGDGGGGGGGGGPRRRGTCKWFNVAKGWGFISPDDGSSDVFVHQSVIQMSGFRSLGDGEEVEFECKATGKGLEATLVTGPKGSPCVGSSRRPVSKKRFRKFRCYNCGEFANHLAAKCSLGPQPKRCHFCKSDAHLIADCPSKPEDKHDEKAGKSSVNGSNDAPESNGDAGPPSNGAPSPSPSKSPKDDKK